jgi:hypothetical protein
MSRNVALGGGGGAADRNSGGVGGALGRVGARGGVQAHLGLFFGQSWGGRGAGAWARRCSAPAAAAVLPPARRQRCQSNAWHGDVLLAPR